MKIALLDDEPLALKRLNKSVSGAEPDAEIFSYESAKELFADAKEKKFDVAFLDIRGLDIDGVTLAKKLKKINPKINIIFSTAYSEYALDAMEMAASGYLMKPITKKKVEKALDELRYPVVEKSDKLRIQTFGNFEAFLGGNPIIFKHAKTKELLAFLFDHRGASCTTNETIVYLWEDDADHSSYMKQIRKDLFDTFEKLNLSDLIVKQRGSLAIKFDEIDSDLKDWDAGLASGINAYRGEYMNQYSWAEETAAALMDF